jgi:hypothetical protein
MSYRFAGEVRTSLPPFYVERLFAQRLAAPGAGLGRWLHERWRKLRGRNTRDPFVDSDLVRALEAALGPAEALAAAAEHPERALRHFEHILDLWCALRPARLGRLVFALQPVPDWFGRPLSEPERRLAAASESHRPDAWRRLQAPLKERAPAFRRGLLRALGARHVQVVDLNTEPRLLALEWVFIDRYHLTDEAQRVVAEILADAVRG